MPNLRSTSLAAAFLAIASLSQQLSAQQPVKNSSVDVGAFAKEVMAIELRDGKTHLALWLPYEFFVAAALNEGKTTREAAERELAFLKPFLTLVVQSSIDQLDGSSAYADEKEMRARGVLKLPDGTEVLPLDKVPPMVSAAMAAMKAIISSEGDAGSANMHVLIFPAVTARGQKIVDTSRQDKLTLILKANPRFKQTSFTWRTPFDSLVSVPDCPRCKAGVSAKWSHCPYCGQKLPHE